MSSRVAGFVMSHVPGVLWRRLPDRLRGAVIDAWMGQFESVQRLRREGNQ